MQKVLDRSQLLDIRETANGMVFIPDDYSMSLRRFLSVPVCH
jgi:hypothetical protein